MRERKIVFNKLDLWLKIYLKQRNLAYEYKSNPLSLSLSLEIILLIDMCGLKKIRSKCLIMGQWG